MDIPVPEGSAFVFWRDGSATTFRARTMREFVSIVARWPDSALQAHMQRHDFSRWIARVVGDHALSKTIELLEAGQASGDASINARAITHAVRARYQLLDPKSEGNAFGLRDPNTGTTTAPR
jgi:hypothetical protein